MRKRKILKDGVLSHVSFCQWHVFRRVLWLFASSAALKSTVCSWREIFEGSLCVISSQRLKSNISVKHFFEFFPAAYMIDGVNDHVFCKYYTYSRVNIGSFYINENGSKLHSNTKLYRNYVKHRKCRIYSINLKVIS